MRLAVIGCGDIGRRYARMIVAAPGLDKVGSELEPPVPLEWTT